MLVVIEGHTVPHFKAPFYSKLELWGLKYDGTLSIKTGLLGISRSLHKMGFVQTEIATTVGALNAYLLGFEIGPALMNKGIYLSLKLKLSPLKRREFSNFCKSPFLVKMGSL